MQLQVSGQCLQQVVKPCAFQTGCVPSGSVATDNFGSCTCNNGVYEKCSYATIPFHVWIELNTSQMLWSYKSYVSIMDMDIFQGGVIDLPAIQNHCMSPEICSMPKHAVTICCWLNDFDAHSIVTQYQQLYSHFSNTAISNLPEDAHAACGHNFPFYRRQCFVFSQSAGFTTTIISYFHYLKK